VSLDADALSEQKHPAAPKTIAGLVGPRLFLVSVFKKEAAVLARSRFAVLHGSHWKLSIAHNE